jgi:hypothetical protein
VTSALLNFVISACLGVIAICPPEGPQWVVVLASWLSGALFCVGVVELLRALCVANSAGRSP